MPKEITPKFKEGDTCFFLTPSGLWRRAVVISAAEERLDYRLYCVAVDDDLDKTCADCLSPHTYKGDLASGREFIVGEHIMKNLEEMVAHRLMHEKDEKDSSGDLCTS